MIDGAIPMRASPSCGQMQEWSLWRQIPQALPSVSTLVVCLYLMSVCWMKIARAKLNLLFWARSQSVIVGDYFTGFWFFGEPDSPSLLFSLLPLLCPVQLYGIISNNHKVQEWIHTLIHRPNAPQPPAWFCTDFVLTEQQNMIDSCWLLSWCWRDRFLMEPVEDSHYVRSFFQFKRLAQRDFPWALQLVLG